MIAVIDYKMGNLRSVEKALQVAGARTKVTSDPRDLARASKIVFPGVGSFGAAMAELKRLKLVKPLKDAIASGKPFLGLCLGLQLLFEKSEESPGVNGLGVLAGTVKRFRFAEAGLKVPHMGWNAVDVSRCGNLRAAKLLARVPHGSYMYFVHSYYVEPRDDSTILTTTDYGIEFASSVCKDAVFGLQFHPEKSQALGLRILRNFVSMR